MNSDSSGSIARTAAYFVAILGALLIMACVVLLVKSYTQPAPANAARVAERIKASQDVAHAVATELDSYGYHDPAKGQIRMPIKQALDLSVPLWRNPASVRSNLVARFDKLNPPPPPPVRFD